MTAIGWRAHAALVASRGRAEVVAPLSTSFYADAAGELLWVGPPGSPLHARAVIVTGAPAAVAGAIGALAVDGVPPWRPRTVGAPSAVIRESARIVRVRVIAADAPRGFARLLLPGGDDEAITARARPHARALAAACMAGDAAAAAEAAQPLLGLGPGLTPSGDDYVGGALFARRLVETCATGGWNAAIARIAAAATTRTHPISARILADLAGGEGWAPLHDLAAALAARDEGGAIRAARQLTTLGHTSGWDVLAGFLIGLGVAPVG